MQCSARRYCPTLSAPYSALIHSPSKWKKTTKSATASARASGQSLPHSIPHVPSPISHSLTLKLTHLSVPSQIACADVIILNKADLVSPDDLSSTSSILHGVNPTAPVHTTVRGELDLAHIMSIGGYGVRGGRTLATEKPPSPVDATCSSLGHDHDHEHAHEHRASTHYEMRGISSLQVSFPTLSQSHLDAFDAWIRSVLWEERLPGSEPSGIQVLRCKGLFSLSTGKQYVLQGVRSLYEITEVEGDAELGLPDEGKVVLIGKGLGDDIRRSLESVLLY